MTDSIDNNYASIQNAIHSAEPSKSAVAEGTRERTRMTDQDSNKLWMQIDNVKKNVFRLSALLKSISKENLTGAIENIPKVLNNLTGSALSAKQICKRTTKSSEYTQNISKSDMNKKFQKDFHIR